jgi:uncharacterized protein YjbI with pentapeptide repeats
MANPEHLAKLKEGVEAWNEWRKANPYIYVDLIDAKLTKANLSDANLSRCNLSGATLIGASLINANLSSAKLVGTKLMNANLVGTSLFWTDFTNAKLISSDLSGSKSFAVFIHTVDSAPPKNKDIHKAENMYVDFTGADLTEAKCRVADFNGANFTGANLKSVDFSGSDFMHSIFKNTDMSNVDLNGSNIGYSIFSNVNLSLARGLDTIIHKGPSTIGLDTFYRSQGNIPEIFLRGCGVPDQIIAYARSLTNTPIQYYSCFISYSHNDEEFAQRLFEGLQAKNVRCWLASEDMKIGDKIRLTIDESIRVHDKLLLILSERSVQSDWVEHEVEHALDRERIEKKNILFPVRLDDAVMDCTTGWAGNVKRQRHIGDFTRWKDHDAYKAAFDRLLRDLKTKM